jgi:nitrate reductase gamma subunit
MDAWLEWARGPAFRFAIIFAALGLSRHLVLTLLSVRRAVRAAGDKEVPYKRLLVTTLGWLFPFTKIRQRVVYSTLSVAFHVGLIITPIFLAGHIVLWRRGLGFGWPAIGMTLADVLTVVTMVTALGLLVGRLWTHEARALSRPQDYILLVLLLFVFLFGFLVRHPALNPFDPTTTFFIHVLAGDLVLVALPVTKLSHCVLLPTTQLVSDVGWRFPPDAGERVRAALDAAAGAESA